MTRWLSAIAIAFLAGSLSAAEPGFHNVTFHPKDGEAAKYVVFVPHGLKADAHPPIVLFLHGSGESGSDGEKQAKTGLGKFVRAHEKTFPMIAVFPQSQKRTWKADSEDGKRAMAILEEVEKKYHTDPHRVYLTGLSMGGNGTWSFAAAYPKRWAAIAPICGWGDVKTADSIKDIPCWNFHGDADAAVKVEKSREMIKALKDAGGKPKYDEYPGVPHQSWDKAYATPGLFDWMLEHKTK